MHDVQSWIETSGARIMLIYGQNDPWTAGAVDLGAATDSFKYIAPNGNHGSTISMLPADERDEAMAAILRWAGVQARGHFVMNPSVRTAEQVELERRPRL
jgi:hypothetical protein